MGAIASPRPLLFCPVEIDIVPGIPGSRPKIAAEALNNCFATLGERAASKLPRPRPFQVADESSRYAVGRRDVICEFHGPDVADGLAGKSVLPPERLIVDAVALDHRSLGDLLAELIAQSGEWRRVPYSARQRRWNCDDDPPSLHLHRVAN